MLQICFVRAFRYDLESILEGLADRSQDNPDEDTLTERAGDPQAGDHL